MSKPDDIPLDIWEGATAINAILTDDGVAKYARLVAAERERAADCAEAMLRLGFALPGEEQLVSLIASAIRKGSHP